MKITHSFLSALLLCAASFAANTVWAYQFSIDDFTVIRNGTVYFDDSFSDGAPPPVAPNYADGSAATYGGNGTVGPEANGKLTLNSTGTAPSFDPRYLSQKVTLKTNSDQTNTTKGLKAGDTFSVTALYDLIVPQVVDEKYAIELQDDFTTLPDGSVDHGSGVRLQVRRASPSEVVIRFMRKIHADNSAIIYALTPLETGHDQIRLTLARANAGTSDITASYAYVDKGIEGTPVAFTATTSLFNGEKFTRPAFYASTPVAAGTASGSLNSQSLIVNLKIDEQRRNQNGNIYLAALLGGAVYFHNGSQWTQWTGGPFPVYWSGQLAEQSINVIDKLNVTGLAGTEVYVGYGLNDADMLNNQMYSLVYTVPSN